MGDFNLNQLNTSNRDQLNDLLERHGFILMNDISHRGEALQGYVPEQYLIFV